MKELNFPNKINPHTSADNHSNETTSMYMKDETMGVRRTCVWLHSGIFLKHPCLVALILLITISIPFPLIYNNLRSDRSIKAPMITNYNAVKTKSSHSSIDPLQGCFFNMNWKTLSQNDLHHIKNVVTKIPIIVIMNSQRVPVLQSTKCSAIPMSTILVSKDYYFVSWIGASDQLIIERSNCTEFDAICFRFDMYNILSVLLNKFKHETSIDWILTFEDDILFCPKLFDIVFNITNNFDQFVKNLNISDNIPQYIELGDGSTGMLWHKNGLQRYLNVLHVGLQHINDPNWDNEECIMHYMRKHNWKGSYAMWQFLTYHSKNIKSTQNHILSHDSQCYGSKNKSTFIIPHFDILRYPYELLKV